MDEWHSPLSEFLKWLAAGGKSPDTVRLRRLQLWRLARAFPRSPWDVTLEDLTDFMSVEHWKAETRRSMRCAIQTFYKWAVQTGRLERSPAEYLPTVRVPGRRPRPAPDSALQRALLVADVETQLMLMLAAYAGLRRKEISEVHTDWVVDDQLYVRGKGDKERVVPLHPVLQEALRSGPPGYVFPGKVNGHRGADYVGRRMSKALGEGWTAHTLRHRFSTLAYAVERDMFAVQQLMGHASPATTAHYTALPHNALVRAVMAAGPSIAA